MTNPYPYLRQADVYVHASRFEGKSIAIQEAQVLGKAIVVSDCSGNREQVEPGKDGLMCDLTPEAVCRELKKVSGIGLLTGSGEQVTALQWQEAKFMENIADREGRIGISKVGVAGDGRIRYLSGPLVKVGSMVKKVDLHKRTAEVETSFMGEKHVLYLGIELPGD